MFYESEAEDACVSSLFAIDALLCVKVYLVGKTIYPSSFDCV